MSGYSQTYFSVYQSITANLDAFQLYFSLATSALEYQDSINLFSVPNVFPKSAYVDQSSLPSYVGSLPSLPDLVNCCYDDESLMQALAFTYGPEYATVIYNLFSDLLNSCSVTLTVIANGMGIPGVPQTVIQYQTAYQPQFTQSFNLSKQTLGSFYLFVPMPLHMWFEALLTGTIWTRSTSSMTLLGASDFTTATTICIQEGPWLWPYSSFANSTLCVLGVMEVSGNAVLASPNVYQITAANPTLIEYLLIFPYPGQASTNATVESVPAELEVVHEKPLERHIEEKLALLERNFAGSGSIASNKRIINEYKAIHTSKGIQGIAVEFEGGNNMYVWLIHVQTKYFDLPDGLKKDFQSFAKTCRRRSEIVFESRFDSGYPQTPPFMRVVSPRFAFHTGHITIGGSICTESLTTQGWTASRTIESILIEVISNMGVGNARLDRRMMGVDYTLEEAKEAFHRVARQHGWQ